MRSVILMVAVKEKEGNRLWRSTGLWDIKAPRFRQSAHRQQWGCQSYAPVTLFTPRDILGTHFYQGLSRPQGYSAAGSIRLIEKSDDLNRNLTHDLPEFTKLYGIKSQNNVILIFTYYITVSWDFIPYTIQFCIQIQMFQRNLLLPSSD
jgi:hypothetical protein